MYSVFACTEEYTHAPHIHRVSTTPPNLPYPQPVLPQRHAVPRWSCCDDPTIQDNVSSGATLASSCTGCGCPIRVMVVSKYIYIIVISIKCFEHEYEVVLRFAAFHDWQEWYVWCQQKYIVAAAASALTADVEFW